MERKYLFNEVAKEYDQIRPSYPNELFQEIINYAKTDNNCKILEVGCGTGKATQGFIDLGYKNITCIEIGKNLADLTREKYKDEQTVKVIHSSFEEWESDLDEFDLTISATAFHFINPEIGYKKVYHLLKSNGTIALFWTIHVPVYDHLHNEIREIYRTLAPHLDDSMIPSPDEVIIERLTSIKNSCLFKEIEVKEYQLIFKYSTKEYISLLDTHSKHRQLEPQTKTLLFNRIEDVINNYGGFIEKPQYYALFLGRK